MNLRCVLIGVIGVANLCAVIGLPAADPQLPGTQPLTQQRPLDEVMVAGIDRFALREIEQARQQRAANWPAEARNTEAYANRLGELREQLATSLGVVDQRATATGIELIATSEQPSLVTENDRFTVHAARWPVLDGITAEGLYLQPKGPVVARVVALPDADWTPEMIAGLQACDSRFAADLAELGCEVLVPTLINRDFKFSGNPSIRRQTNLTHREFIYRQAFELGRHVIGYEVQKVFAAVDQFSLRNEHDTELPIAVVGVSEGGLLALYSAAIDTRIDAAVVSGYFDQREQLWREPIYRNVWGLLTQFGDAEIAGLIAPRSLFVEKSPKIPEISGPPDSGGRNVAAPGVIKRPDPASVSMECQRASKHWDEIDAEASGRFVVLDEGKPSGPVFPPLDSETIRNVVADLTHSSPATPKPRPADSDQRVGFSSDDRQQRQVDEMVRFTQRLLQLSHRQRDQRFANIDRSSAEAWTESSKAVRQQVYAELIGKLPDPTIDPKPRSRQVLQEEEYTGYEVVLDVYPDVIAAGILLLPNDIKPGEKRPVVVCQHGLEGTPMDTISGPESRGYRAYKSFSAELAKRGFIVYAPQNPYRGRDAFRTLQRKSNPLGRSLFSYIIPQHLVTLRWLSTLPSVDSDRIGFYGLSYGGKTAVRVPPMLPPTETDPGYCLSICSADFNEWVSKNASTDATFSYVWTIEYEIFEWNMGHVANYAELSMLMTPRPFMVERGHDDGVGIDEWVAWEYAKVRRHYNKLGLGDRTEIEFFDGPHTINGQATYRFLHRHLDWPE